MSVVDFFRQMFFLERKIVPLWFRRRVDTDLGTVLDLMKFASKQTKSTDLVLDAGAGTCPYKSFFAHARYESTDFEDIFDKSAKNMHTFVCSLDNIPQPDNKYDVIINTQVLEHVEHPQKVIEQFHRILKPGGKLFMSVPLADPLHGEPYHFYNFTKFGLTSMFKKTGFDIKFIKERGGAFRYLGKRIYKIPMYIMMQYLFESIDGNPDNKRFKPSPWALLLFPLYLLSKPFCEYLIPFTFYYLDGLDKKKDYTIGYTCYCTK